MYIPGVGPEAGMFGVGSYQPLSVPVKTSTISHIFVTLLAPPPRPTKVSHIIQ